MGKSNNYGLVVTLTDPEANAITESQPAGQTAAEKLSLVANGLLRDLAKGGAMLAPEWASRVEAAIGTTDAAAVVDAVERSANRSGDATVVSWVVDPTQINFYQMLADNAGISLNHQLKSLLDYAYSQGWFGSAAPDLFKLLLTQEQYRFLQQMFEKDIVTGFDVIEKLQVGSEASWAPPEDDVVLDSLAATRK